MKISQSTRILAVTTNFPSPRFPEKGVFIKNILCEMARQGAKVDVIAPHSWVANIKTIGRGKKNVDFGPLNIYRPIVTIIPLRFFGRFKGVIVKVNDFIFKRAVERFIKNNKKYELCYCHFYRSGKAALNLMKKNKIPIILNFGESSPWIYDDYYGKENWTNDLKRFTAVLSVSKFNKDYLINLNQTLEPKIHYMPNGVDLSRFYPLNKFKCREKLGLPQNEKIVIFVGHFIERKGVLLVEKSINKIGIKGIFLGVGPLKPVGENVLFAGSVVNDELRTWLNAADVFVLPSLAEGMSNAILEALACGLPLVVSDLEFNREFLTLECTQFVNPHSYIDIAKGINYSINPENAKVMRNECLSLAPKYGIDNRIKNIFSLV